MNDATRKGSLGSILGPNHLTPPSSQSQSPIPYNPRRVTPATSVLVPISKLELIQCRNPTGNPLRLSRPPPPSTLPDPTPIPSTSTSAAPTPSLIPPRPSFLPQKPVTTSDAFSNGHGDNGAGSRGGYKRPSSQNYDHGHDRKYQRSAEDTLAVAGHYNSRPNFDVNRRRFSPIIGLKSFNNWIKSVLIAKYGRREGDVNKPRVKVLELGCGKGGDLQKWARAGTDEYVGIDLAAVSIEDAISRWTKMRQDRFPAAFFALDCFSQPISEVLTPEHVLQPFDVVSLQFCMHYAFESETKVRQMLDNVVKYLKPGGVFLGTIPDSTNLLERLARIPLEEEILGFGNDVYKVRFDERDSTPRYGHRYTFFLQDAVEEVPEYIVYWDSFVELAQNYGLTLIYYADFQKIFVDEGQDPHFAELLTKMNVVDSNGDTEMTADQWEAANLYVGFAFTKNA